VDEELFALPRQTRREDGGVRRVGFELEFTGLDLQQASTALARGLDGRIVRETSSEHVVETALGDFAVEVDWDYLKRKARAQADRDGKEGKNESADGGDWTVPLRDVATLFVPVEVVCPPIPMTDLAALLPLVEALRQRGALGTETSAIAAYGVHINTEIPRLDAPTVHRYLRAYSLLQWWLVREHDIDVARRISPYIDSYPEAYLHGIHALEAPSLSDLFDLYFEHNPTRNRSLDMLPLFAEVDAEAVQAATGDPRIKARPAFHYRLPDCRIDDPSWSLAESWNRWCVVEALAEDEEALEALSIDFRTQKRALLGVSKSAWIERVEQWLADRESA